MSILPAQQVLHYRHVTKEEFVNTIYEKHEPAVLHDVDIGSCVSKWTLEYLAERAGVEEVKIHVCTVPQMDFLHKNFLYRSLPFKAFIQRAVEKEHEEYFLCKDEKYYLRSLGSDVRKDVADIKTQFPYLADDINIPEFFDKGQFFSSVFRMASAGTQLWTHYDVMDNLLVQVKGKKRAVLYSPKDALNLYLNGDKSEVLDIDNPDLTRFPDFVKATRYECVLEEGDILFIPALWFHNVISLEFSVAINIFWRELDSSMYDKRDTYGNKDLLLASRAMQVVDRALKMIGELPENYRDFYARLMVAKIESKLFNLPS